MSLNKSLTNLKEIFLKHVQMPCIVITGANRGIGLEFARYFNKLNYTVYGTARNPAEATQLQKIATVIPLDVSDESSIAKLSSFIKHPIDILINNSGLMKRDQLPGIKQTDLLEQFKINACGPIFVSQALIELLETAEHPKVINVTSRMGSIEDNTSGSRYGYRASKAALNIMTKSFSIDKPNIITILIHPGYIKTDMTGLNGDMLPDEAVERMSKIILKADKDSAGKFFHRDGQILPW